MKLHCHILTGWIWNYQMKPLDWQVPEETDWRTEGGCGGGEAPGSLLRGSTDLSSVQTKPWSWARPASSGAAPAPSQPAWYFNISILLCSWTTPRSIARPGGDTRPHLLLVRLQALGVNINILKMVSNNLLIIWRHVLRGLYCVDNTIIPPTWDSKITLSFVPDCQISNIFFILRGILFMFVFHVCGGEEERVCGPDSRQLLLIACFCHNKVIAWQTLDCLC